MQNNLGIYRGTKEPRHFTKSFFRCKYDALVQVCQSQVKEADPKAKTSHLTQVQKVITNRLCVCHHPYRFVED